MWFVRIDKSFLIIHLQHLLLVLLGLLLPDLSFNFLIIFQFGFLVFLRSYSFIFEWEDLSLWCLEALFIFLIWCQDSLPSYFINLILHDPCFFLVQLFESISCHRSNNRELTRLRVLKLCFSIFLSFLTSFDLCININLLNRSFVCVKLWDQVRIFCTFRII